jgi:glycosyltransferase involved in cell wall biosynthesis
LRALHLEDHVSLRGELDAEAMAACYDAVDLFVLATFKETYGMAVAEALAYGIPVVSTTTGAIPALVGSDAGLLAAPGDEAGFTAALTRAVTDPSLRRSLAAGARDARSRIPSWEQTLDRITAALEPLHE